MSADLATENRVDRSERAERGGRVDARAARLTLYAFAGSALGILPLLQLLRDTNWLLQAWIAMAIVIVPAGLIRLRRPASALHLVPGVILLIGYLTRIYLPTHAWLGIIPTRKTWSDLSTMSTVLGNTIHDSAAPLNSTAPIRLYMSVGLALLAIVVDLLVVELRRPALAGVPLLLVFTLAGAIPRDPVSWIWFGLSGIGYLLLLSSSATDDFHRWGRVVARPEHDARSRLTSARSGRRIGVVAVLVAVLVPFVLPLGSVNVLANALHNGQVGIGGNGNGSTGVVIDPLATLRGQLTRSAPISLFSVDVSGANTKSAFYLRSAVLENYTGKAWVQGPSASTSTVRPGGYTVAPSTFGSTITTTQFNATITVAKLAGSAPLFATPTDLTSIPTGWTWNSRYGLIAGDVTSGQKYTETVAQPSPSTQALEASPAVRRAGLANNGVNGQVLQDNLVADNIPAAVTNLVNKIITGANTPYDKALALSSYFTDPANGFVYSLQTKRGESGSDLVDFLTTGKAGFCQQFAASLGVMLRVAGIPARVVLGYSHPAPNAAGHFEVTSDDAHAWVEGYFTGIGWVPFDPTPLTGIDAARAVALPWAPHPQTQNVDATSGPAADPNGDIPKGDQDATSGTSTSATTATGSATSTAWLGLAALAFIVLAGAAVPWLLRIRRRRQRVRQARTHGPEPLWRELADTTVDLGLGWSGARSSRQVATWLDEHLSTESARSALRDLAGVVERTRYAREREPQRPAGEPTAGSDAQRSVSDLDVIRRDLLASVRPITRWRARLLPASLWSSGDRVTGADRLLAETGRASR